MTIQTKRSALAVMEETTENSPVAPSAATSYIALQGDESLDPGLETLENAELVNTLAPKQPLAGLEQPSFTMTHYLRHSGTAGTKPNYSPLLKSLFGGEEVATQRTTTTGSNLYYLRTGQPDDFRIGQAILLNERTTSSEGYQMRPIKSIDSANLRLHLGFKLAGAGNETATSAKNLGQAITYYPSNEGNNPSLTLWHYLGSGSGVQMMSGGIVDSVTIEANPNEFLTASYNVSGRSYFYNPILITASNRYLNFKITANRTISLEQRYYKTPHDVAAILKDEMDAAEPGRNINVVYSDSTGKFTISSSSNITLQWSTGANASNSIGTTIGFSTSADQSGSASYTSPNALSLATTHSPSYDSANPLEVKDHEMFIGGVEDNTCFQATSVSVTIQNSTLPIKDVCASTGVSNTLVNGRTATVSVSALIDKYQAIEFNRYYNKTAIGFSYAFGTRNKDRDWEAGKCGMIYMPNATMSSLSVVDSDGLYAVDFELTAFGTNDNQEEIFLSFV